MAYAGGLLPALVLWQSMPNTCLGGVTTRAWEEEGGRESAATSYIFCLPSLNTLWKSTPPPRFHYLPLPGKIPLRASHTAPDQTRAGVAGRGDFWEQGAPPQHLMQITFGRGGRAVAAPTSTYGRQTQLLSCPGGGCVPALRPNSAVGSDTWKVGDGGPTRTWRRWGYHSYQSRRPPPWCQMDMPVVCNFLLRYHRVTMEGSPLAGGQGRWRINYHLPLEGQDGGWVSIIWNYAPRSACPD